MSISEKLLWLLLFWSVCLVGLWRYYRPPHSTPHAPHTHTHFTRRWTDDHIQLFEISFAAARPNRPTNKRSALIYFSLFYCAAMHAALVHTLSRRIMWILTKYVYSIYILIWRYDRSAPKHKYLCVFFLNKYFKYTQPTRFRSRSRRDAVSKVWSRYLCARNECDTRRVREIFAIVTRKRRRNFSRMHYVYIFIKKKIRLIIKWL